MKYRIESKDDYTAFLWGLIIQAADAVGAAHHDAALDFISRYRTHEELEDYLEYLRK